MNIDILSKLIVYKDFFKFIPQLQSYYEKYLQIKDTYHCVQEPFKSLLKKYNDVPGKLLYTKLYNNDNGEFLIIKRSGVSYYPRI